MALKYKNYVFEGLVDKRVDSKKSRIPARLDYLQSLSGVILAIFIKFHLLFVSSILVSNDFMYKVDKILSGSLFIEGGSPLFITIFASVIFFIVIVHALLAVRKFPNSYRQFRNFHSHSIMYPHEDTKLWAVQAITGFILFFVASIHLYQMISEPANIGPYLSSYRIWHENSWVMYIILLISVELHATVGLYRLIVKWGWFNGKTYKATREKLKKIRNSIIVFYIILGLLSLGAYMKIGSTLNSGYAIKYTPSYKVVK
jgi:fumarate reductase subunit C